jgi:hypothetical protein
LLVFFRKVCKASLNSKNPPQFRDLEGHLRREDELVALEQASRRVHEHGVGDAVRQVRHADPEIRSKFRGRCYDHNFPRFLPIFGKKMALFSKTNVMIKILLNLALF